MTLPTSVPQSKIDALKAKEPSTLHTSFAEYLSAAMGVEVTPKQVQFFLGLHGSFQKSPEWRAQKEADKRNAAAALSAAKKVGGVKKVAKATENPSTGEFEVPWPMVGQNEKGVGTEFATASLDVQKTHGAEIHKVGCADLQKIFKGHQHTVWADSPEHARDIELATINWSDGEGFMGYDLDHVKIMPCARQKAAPKPRPRPVKRSMKARVTDMRNDGATEDEVDQALIEEENTPKPAPKASPRVRRAVKKVAK